MIKLTLDSYTTSGRTRAINEGLLTATIILGSFECRDSYRLCPSRSVGTTEVLHVELVQEILALVGHVAFKLERLLHLPPAGLVPSHLSCHLRWERGVIAPGCCGDCCLYCCEDHSYGTETSALPCQQPVIPLCPLRSGMVPGVACDGPSVILNTCRREQCTCPKPHSWEVAGPEPKRSWLSSR